MKKIIDGITYLDLLEWQQIGARLYGENPRFWKFQCPNCKHIQTAQDFLDLIEKKILPKDFRLEGVAFFSCIGRYDTRLKKVGTISKDKIQPCDYTNGGLFNLSKVIVQINDKTSVSVFDYPDDYSYMFDSEGNYLKP